MNRNYLVLDNHRNGEDLDATSETSSMDIENEAGARATSGKLIPKPPMFYGERRELSYFLSRLEKYFKYNLPEETTDEEKIDILSCYLSGKAAEWFSNLEKEESPLLRSYENLVAAMQERYKTCPSTDVANAKLCKMKATNYRSTGEYC
eukprot:jgi/Orpsp1_1/1186536/evm.model.d7180000051280.1